MQEQPPQTEPIPPEIQEIVRNIVSAIRAVKLYPPNNPVYAQAVRKSYESLDSYLAGEPAFPLGVQKVHFTYGLSPVAKDAHLSKAISQDLFAKGIREIVFHNGITEEELLTFYRVLTLTPEELAMKNGISSLLWERGAPHVKVAEAALDEVVLQAAGSGGNGAETEKKIAGVIEPQLAAKGILLAGRTLLLGDLLQDPQKFGAAMVEMAGQGLKQGERVEDRLFSLYQDAGRQVLERHPEAGDTLFEGLAKSILSLDAGSRAGLIAGKLYMDLDARTVQEDKDGPQEQVPNETHEVLTGRFARSWTVGQVSTLLRKSASQPPAARAVPDATPIPQEIVAMAADLAEYTPGELEELKAVAEAGAESDIVETAVRTLIYLLPMVRNPYRTLPQEKELSLFAGVIRQLEDLLSYLLKRKDYDMACLIIRALRMPVDPAFRPRAAEALKKASSRNVIAAVVTDLRKFPKDSARYRAAYSYLELLHGDATPMLLEILAEEPDRLVRRQLIDILKDLGKNQLALLGQRLSDERWYFVRNIVSILGDSRTDEAVSFLEKVSDHKNFQIRQEVVRALITIGGRKAVGLLTRFLNDRDVDIRFMAIRGLATTQGAGPSEAKSVTAFLAGMPLRKKGSELIIEAIRTLGKIGDGEAASFLSGYERVRWWKPRRLQEDVRAAALGAQEEIKRRSGGVGRAG